MLNFSVSFEGPIAFRYPRGEAYEGLEAYRAPIELGKSEWIYDETEIMLIAVGSMVKTAVKVRQNLKEKGFACSLVNARFVKPLDEKMLMEAAQDHKLVVTMEENVKTGGFGEQVAAFYTETGSNIAVLQIAIPDQYVEHGNVEILKKEQGIDESSIEKRIIASYIGQ